MSLHSILTSLSSRDTRVRESSERLIDCLDHVQQVHREANQRIHGEVDYMRLTQEPALEPDHDHCWSQLQHFAGANSLLWTCPLGMDFNTSPWPEEKQYIGGNSKGLGAKTNWEEGLSYQLFFLPSVPFNMGHEAAARAGSSIPSTSIHLGAGRGHRAHL